MSIAATAGVNYWARYNDAEVDALHERFGNSTDVDGRRAAYLHITGATFSQDHFARYACLKPRA
ncbi:hypothetical protein [Plastoroseomonas arctica]|uniref:Uncharacterized protein n=1 Tax=Plastoroseomonas arctica TaxID=1509237 RepID=A0AAF1JX39_9PROT|nr:hypothetical protein [Plastoroseomonas arctica]MBR0655495.1 hypothetical protein [Plastoroseomonas arctica]